SAASWRLHMSTSNLQKLHLIERAPEETEAQREARWRPIREREEARRKAEQADINGLVRETGLDFESARLLYKFRNRIWLENHEEEFCEPLENRLAMQKAEHALPRASADIDWDALDEQRRRGRTPERGRASDTTEQPSETGQMPFIDMSSWDDVPAPP